MQYTVYRNLYSIDEVELLCLRGDFYTKIYQNIFIAVRELVSGIHGWSVVWVVRTVINYCYVIPSS